MSKPVKQLVEFSHGHIPPNSRGGGGGGTIGPIDNLSSPHDKGGKWIALNGVAGVLPSNFMFKGLSQTNLRLPRFELLI